MNGKPKKLKDTNGQYILPITHSDLVYVEENKNLTQKLSEIGSGGGVGGGSGAVGINDYSTTSTIETWSAQKINNELVNKSDNTHKHNISDLEGVDVTNKTSGYVPMYDSTAGKFVSKPLPTGTGSGATNLDGLSDVDVTTTPPIEGKALTYQSGIWKPGNVGEAVIDFQANAESPLYIPSYNIDGNYTARNMAMHPSVMYFPSKFGGYNFWIAHTPYSNAFNENPCVAASMDGIHWVIPNGLVNPLDSVPIGEKDDWYFSDTHLVYKQSTNTLECWYRRATLAPAKNEILYRRTTTNGTTWTAPEEMYKVEGYPQNNRILSPSIIWDNTLGLYHIWVIENTSNVIYFQSTDGKTWSMIRDTGLRCWHLDVQKNGGDFEYVLYHDSGTPSLSKLTYTKSTDNTSFSPEITLMTGRGSGYWDCSLYRSALVKVGSQYRLYYTGKSEPNAGNPDNFGNSIWRTGLSISTRDNDITSLQGYNGSYLMSPQPDTTAIVDLSSISSLYPIKTTNVMPYLSGNTSDRKKFRPTDAKWVGVPYYDKNLGKPLWLKTIGNFAWVDANGTTIVDTDTPPTISQNIVNIMVASGQSVIIDYVATDDIEIATHAYSKDGGTTYINLGPKNMGNGNWRLTIAGLASGTYNFKIGVKDMSQQWTYSNTFTVTVV